MYIPVKYKLNIIHLTIKKIHKYVNSRFISVRSKIIDTTYGSFISLDINEDHEAFGPKDTFYIDSKYILRPHATNFQHIVIDQYNQLINNNCSDRYIGFYNLGKVFRKDDSSTHHYCFHQCDIMIFGPSASISDLYSFFVGLFDYLDIEANIRIRNSYFPFTFPSYEVDLMWKDKYLEIAGMGITSTNHMKKKIHNSIKCIAVGIGIERISCIINDADSIKKARYS